MYCLCLVISSFAAQCAPFHWIWLPGQLHHDRRCKSVAVVGARRLISTGGTAAFVFALMCGAMGPFERHIVRQGAQ